MSETFGYKQISAARRDHDCWWCGELILKGEPYERWMNADHFGMMELKAHPECNEAWMLASRKWGEPYHAEFGGHCRGCDCQHGRCECKERSDE